VFAPPPRGSPKNKFYNKLQKNNQFFILIYRCIGVSNCSSSIIKPFISTLINFHNLNGDNPTWLKYKIFSQQLQVG